MCLDKKILYQIVGGNSRFANPFNNPESYFIVNLYTAEETYLVNGIERYYDKLRYAVNHADRLIEGAFDDTFYNFYGVNKKQVKSPAQMCSRLQFDSFSLNMEDNSTCAYLSNHQFMFGHFIEVLWDSDWNVKNIWIN